MNTFRFIFTYIRRHRLRYAAGILTLFVVDYAGLFIPKLTGTVTDGLAARTLDWDGVVSCLVSIFILGLTLAAGFSGASFSSGRPAPSNANCATICLPISKK